MTNPSDSKSAHEDQFRLHEEQLAQNCFMESLFLKFIIKLISIEGAATMSLTLASVSKVHTVTLLIAGLASFQFAEPADSQTAGKVLLTLDIYDVQCGIISNEGLPVGANPRSTFVRCKLAATTFENGEVEFEFTGKIGGRAIQWSYQGDAKLNVYKKIKPQLGGKFNRSARNDRACFVAFDVEDLDDTESLFCYKNSTLRKLYGWDRKNGSTFPIP